MLVSKSNLMMGDVDASLLLTDPYTISTVELLVKHFVSLYSDIDPMQ